MWCETGNCTKKVLTTEQATEIILDAINYICNHTPMKSNNLVEQTYEIGHYGDETYLLREIVRVHQALLNVFSREVGMPIARLLLLRVIFINRPKEMGTMEIARNLGINAAAVTRNINELEEQGLVIRRQDIRDGRRSYVSLTPQGEKKFAGIEERSREFEEQLENRLNKENIDIATKIMGEVRAFLESIR